MRSAKVGKCCKLGLQFQDGTDIRTHCGEEATMGGSVTAFNSFCGGGASLTQFLLSQKTSTVGQFKKRSSDIYRWVLGDSVRYDTVTEESSNTFITHYTCKNNSKNISNL